jgi:hypothetical protein
MPGCRSATQPSTKKVPVTPACANISSRRSVFGSTRLASDSQRATGAAALSAFAWK